MGVQVNPPFGNSTTSRDMRITLSIMLNSNASIPPLVNTTQRVVMFTMKGSEHHTTGSDAYVHKEVKGSEHHYLLW